MRLIRAIICFWLFLGLARPVAWAAPDSKTQPVSISADQMEADDRQQVVLFFGSVVARQEDMVLSCDRMKVFYDKENPKPGPARGQDANSGSSLLGGQSQIVQIVAEGNVKITRGDRVAQAQKAVYKAKAVPRTIVLTGEPRIWRDKDFLTGKKITYYLDEDRSVVEGGGKNRVNAIFYQGDNVSKDGEK